MSPAWVTQTQIQTKADARAEYRDTSKIRFLRILFPLLSFSFTKVKASALDVVSGSQPGPTPQRTLRGLERCATEPRG